jgi:hypothetical protein
MSRTMVTGLPFRYRFHYRYQLVHFQRHHLSGSSDSIVCSINNRTATFTVTVALSQLVGFGYHRFGIRWYNFLRRIFRHYYSSCSWMIVGTFPPFIAAGVVIVNVKDLW